MPRYRLLLAVIVMRRAPNCSQDTTERRTTHPSVNIWSTAEASSRSVLTLKTPFASGA